MLMIGQGELFNHMKLPQGGYVTKEVITSSCQKSSAARASKLGPKGGQKVGSKGCGPNTLVNSGFKKKKKLQS